jgi:hypothetical protein
VSGVTSRNGHSKNGNGLAKLDAEGKPTETAPVLRGPGGQFLTGTAAGPGRPEGSLDFMKIARAYCERSGHDLSRVVEIAGRALTRAAAKGDVPAIKVLLDRTCGVQDKGTTVNVGVDARTAATLGPAIPQGADFVAYVEKFNRVAATQKLLGDTTPEQLVEDAARAAIDEQNEIEDLLS